MVWLGFEPGAGADESTELRRHQRFLCWQNLCALTINFIEKDEPKRKQKILSILFNKFTTHLN